jgi:hypothetical protein
MSFKDDFLKTPPGPKREQLIYNAIINQGPPKNLVPVTVDGPNGIKITYKVMPDYVSIDGIRVPMTGTTAQKIADHFGMNLPTTKQSKQIWQAADTKLKPTPMSGGAKINGKYYTGKQVVDSKISDSDTSVAFNQKIEDELSKAKPGVLVAGHMKDIIQPDRADRLGITGWYLPDGTPIQKGNISSHDIASHSEYASGARLIADDIEVTLPNGKKVKTTMENLMSDPKFGKLYQTLGHTPGVKKYDISKGPALVTNKSPAAPAAPAAPAVPAVPESKPVSHTYTPAKPQSGRLQFLQRIENFLNSIT